MSAPKEDFFAAGLRHYGDAYRAIAEFRELLVAELQQALVEPGSSSSVRLASDPGFTTSVGPVHSAYFAVSGKLAFPANATEESTALNVPRLELGLWWAPSFDRTNVVTYAGIHGLPWSKRLTTTAPFKIFKGSTAYITTALRQGDELRPQLLAVLSALDAANKAQLPPAPL